MSIHLTLIVSIALLLCSLIHLSVHAQPVSDPTQAKPTQSTPAPSSLGTQPSQKKLDLTEADPSKSTSTSSTSAMTPSKTASEKCQVEEAEGLSPTQRMIEVKGMLCQFCVQGIEAQLKEQLSAREVKLNLDDGTVHVAFKQSDVLPQHICDAVYAAGYYVQKLHIPPMIKEEVEALELPPHLPSKEAKEQRDEVP